MAVSTSTPNDLMVVFSNTITNGFTALAGPVNGVFGTMIVLVVALTGIQWALSPNRELLASAVGKILLIGAFAWLINDWQALSETIYRGFLQLGLTAGGGGVTTTDFFNPGAILEEGWKLVKAMGDIQTHGSGPLDVVGNITDALILAVAMIGVMLSFAILALQIIVALLEFKIVTLGGFVLLPFGIWSKSAFLAERPLGYVVSAGLKVLALGIVVSGAKTVFGQLTPSADPDVYEALAILVASLLLALLAFFIPNLAASLVTGGPTLAAGSALSTGMVVGGTAALATAAARPPQRPPRHQVIRRPGVGRPRRPAPDHRAPAPRLLPGPARSIRCRRRADPTRHGPDAPSRPISPPTPAASCSPPTSRAAL